MCSQLSFIIQYHWREPLRWPQQCHRPYSHTLVSFTLPLRMRCAKAIEDQVYRKIAFILSSLALWSGGRQLPCGGAHQPTAREELRPSVQQPSSNWILPIATFLLWMFPNNIKNRGTSTIEPNSSITQIQHLLRFSIFSLLSFFTSAFKANPRHYIILPLYTFYISLKKRLVPFLLSKMSNQRLPDIWQQLVS